MKNLLMIIDMFIFFLTSFMTAIGMGGGGILIAYLTVIRGYSGRESGDMSLFVFIIISSLALVFHGIKGRINKKGMICLVGYSILGGIFGSIVSRYISATLLKILFGVFLVFTGASSLIIIIPP